ncbi:MAG: hypothetical protein HOU81_00945 [Hamadaea sp.]|uniref:hypothetical protein n=1 Tax=Hamadaea sp. TaxID=2024425 RepID=UPI001820DCDF|nr:hypothetical protein [Hamadaea sp.]NUR69364.1 hypothetical protein [Hamadaea sp.]NUT23181.1 hypothetical protein [Hamadaea sp.]
MTDPVADLYALPQAEFTAARDAAAKAAKASGDAELAARIGKLRKPNAVAWLANQLVRQRRKAVEKLVDLGDQLRTATAQLDGEKLRRLSARQHEVVADLVRQAHELADRPVTDATERGLEQTLRSALADPAAAEELLAGQLSEGLARIGFTGLLSAVPSGEPARPLKSVPRTSKSESTSDKAAEEAEAAEREEQAENKKLRKAAEAARKRAEADLADAEATLRTARDTVDDLKQRLDAAYEERAEADRQVQAARKRLQQADRDARLAARGLTDVSARAASR